MIKKKTFLLLLVLALGLTVYPASSTPLASEPESTNFNKISGQSSDFKLDHLTEGSEDDVASVYYQLLQKHTRWVEEIQWDAQKGYYNSRDFAFVSVLGNAVLLKFGQFDPELTGISYEDLKDHTLRTIEHFAASNMWAGGSEWGGKIFWDSTYESYFVAAAKLMWPDLAADTRQNINAIIVGSADYVSSLGTNEDPRSGGWSSNGLKGGYKGDSKIEEMGAKSIPLAVGVAYAPDHMSAQNWREWLNKWTTNMTGLPVADQANTTIIDGKPVAEWNEAHNIYDTFIVENHDSFAPHYQQSIGNVPGRNIVQFLIVQQPIPQALKMLPNSDELWGTLSQLGTDSGVAAHLMVADRHHLYGRDILPLAYRSMVLGDPYGARAELMLLEHLVPYQDYPPTYRLTKFSGEPKYEFEARAELAMAYLLHYWRDQLAGDVTPVTKEAYFAHFSSAKDYGKEVGLVAQQTPNALAAAVSKPNYVKFAFLPQHDDWFFDVAGSSPSFLPSVNTKVIDQKNRVYEEARDGFDGTATLFRTDTGFAGFTTLPSGKVVYATSGLAKDEGILSLYNLLMPGIPGLDGNRTFHAEGKSVTLGSDGNGKGGIDVMQFDPTDVRYIRMLGGKPATQYGYSIWDFNVYTDEGGQDLAQGKTTTASSYDDPYPPSLATDGNSATRWAVSRPERSREDSWLAVDLGSTHKVSTVKLNWEAAYGLEYRIQGSLDGESWFDLATVPETHSFDTKWLNVDGRVGFVIRHNDNPVKVGPQSITLSAGPASGSNGMVVEGYPNQTPDKTAKAVNRLEPYGGPKELKANHLDGFLSLFNLGEQAIEDIDLLVPQKEKIVLYEGLQNTLEDSTIYKVSLESGAAHIEPPRFELAVRKWEGEPLPSLKIEVLNPHHVQVTNLDTSVVQLEITSVLTNDNRSLTVQPGKTEKAVFRGMTAKMEALVERFEQEGEFANHDIARSLQVHLTAVGRYEEKELAIKVIKHMESFQLLLDHQRENEMVSKKAYDILNTYADYLIKRWQ